MLETAELTRSLDASVTERKLAEYDCHLSTGNFATKDLRH